MNYLNETDDNIGSNCPYFFRKRNIDITSWEMNDLKNFKEEWFNDTNMIYAQVNHCQVIKRIIWRNVEI